MKKFPVMWAWSLLLIWLMGCANPVDPGKQPADWMALTARIKGFRQIVLVHVHDPSSFKVITNDEHQNLSPRFSHDKTQLIYEDPTTGFAHDPQLIVYDLKRGKTTPLTVDKMLDDKRKFPITGEGTIWNPANSRIYYRVSDITFSGSEDLLYYDFESRMETRMTRTGGSSEWPVGFKGADTLIVFSNDTATTHQPPGFYFMDLSGRYLSRIENPHLAEVVRNGLASKAARNPSWRNDLKLFVFSQRDSSLFPGFAIAVTNLDGSFYQTYTDGAVRDDHSTWGPDGQTIFFDRYKLTNGDIIFKVMVLDLETGAVREFVKPEDIDGATSLSFPGY